MESQPGNIYKVTKFCKSMPCRTVEVRRHVRVAFRAGDDRSTNIRNAQIIIATYEHSRNILADGEMEIYPGARRMNRKWNEAIGLVIIDEISNAHTPTYPCSSSLICQRGCHMLQCTLFPFFTSTAGFHLKPIRDFLFGCQITVP